MKYVLIVEDDDRISSFMSKGIASKGFRVGVLGSGSQLARSIESDPPDLILLDLGLPGVDGFALLQDMRGRGVDTPVIIVTARDDLEDRVKGLDLGANDYVVKPFRFEELVARIRVQLRQSDLLAQSSSGGNSYVIFGPRGLRLDLRQRLVTVDGRNWIDLSPKECEVLEMLFASQVVPCSRAEILSRIWGYIHDPRSNVVDVYIGYLRRKIGVDRIVSVRGVGYKLV